MSLASYLNINDKIEITVWEEGDDRGNTYNSKILAIEDDKFMVAPPPPSHIRLMKMLEPNTFVGAVLATNTVLIFYPLVQSADRAGIWLEYPRDGKYDVIKEQRHIRIPAQVKINVDYQSGMFKKETVAGKTVDVSASGILLAAPRGFKVKDDVVVRFSLGDIFSHHALNARVVMSKENPKMRTGDDLYLTAVQFVEMGVEQEKRLMDECLRISMDQKHSGHAPS